VGSNARNSNSPGGGERTDRAWLNEFQLHPRTSALLVVDLQYGSIDVDIGYSNIFRHMGHHQMLEARNEYIYGTVVPNVQRLQAAFRAVGASVIFVVVGSIVGDLSDMPVRFRRAKAYCEARGMPAPWGAVGSREMEILREVAPRPGEPVMTKTGASGFTGAPLEQVLRTRGIRELALCGVATTYCVESTLRAAADRSFDCVLVDDACGDLDGETHRRGVASCSYFARIERTEGVLRELAAHEEGQR
jgi:nicotinamidase-related amidase